MKNFILDTDSYKFSHFQGYAPDVAHVYSYAESRGGNYPTTVFFGLQKFIMELAQVEITLQDIDEAEIFAKAHGVPFNREGWEIIAYEHKGKIPVVIKAVPEGTLISIRNVLVTVENTDPRMPWLTSYIETALLRAVWYPTTVATRIHYMKETLKPYFERTSDTGDMGFAILDFSARGCSSTETAEIGGMAHMLSFIGSDNIPAVVAANKFYFEPMAAFSVAATEHSVMCSYGEENEELSFKYLIANMMPENGILSVVSDTWNIYRAVDYWGKLAEEVRAKNATLVIRPDSGDMEEVLRKILPKIIEYFGYNTNSKGYKVLRSVKVLQGDGINESNVHVPFAIAEEFGISADSIMTGSGGGLMQTNIDRDTCKFAFKASNLTLSDGTEVGIAKNPITDPGKRSKKGRLALVRPPMCKDFQTIFERDLEDNTYRGGGVEYNYLRIVYVNGYVEGIESLSQIRERLSKQ